MFVKMFNMQPRITALFISLLLSTALAFGHAKTPAAPGLTYLYSLNCTLADPVLVGQGPHGTRVVIPIVGGSFSGPKLSGMSSRGKCRDCVKAPED
jgi:hypothetical protein